ncbi:hypothetical protein GCM10010211_77570 [Streptomyces albospinus]|uniref:Uncharacterized protein n=1 Tax=Streptomyces albospinus TaxID=285515 RepID=A0ABQ2VPP4_9ACTN|nr:hypothetical protein [Streptomyces albospinus]GGU98678.1 hypothetical protein GCM10010211_77570 [Streptomyces albospinus]
MLHTIRTIFESLLYRLLPARGCHRTADAPRAASYEDTPTLTLARVPAGRPELPLLRGEDVPLIRPYLLTPEERQERRWQRGRRRALWLSVHGIDAGPGRIHGLRVVS